MQLASNVEWLRIYWVRGSHSRIGSLKYEVTDPPTCGWQAAYVMRNEKRCTIFCPFTFQSYSVSNNAAEIAYAKDSGEGLDLGKAEALLNDRWAKFQGNGEQKAYDVCAKLMSTLGWAVPTQILTGGEVDTRERGGKEPAAKLLKPVKKDSKRGKFLEWFLASENGQSVRNAMAEFDMTRSNALSYLFILNKDHGLGYSLVGDTAKIILPSGCSDPFAN